VLPDAWAGGVVCRLCTQGIEEGNDDRDVGDDKFDRLFDARLASEVCDVQDMSRY